MLVAYIQSRLSSKNVGLLVQQQTGRPPNTSLPLHFDSIGGCLSFCVWNARALQHNNPSLAKRKTRKVLELCRQFAVIGLLEVHGCDSHLQQHLKPCKTHVLFPISFAQGGDGKPNLRADGISVLVDKRLLAWNHDSPTYHPKEILQVYQTLVPGRGVRLLLTNQSNKSFAVTFVHNFGLTTNNMVSLEKSIKTDMNLSKVDPLNFGGIVPGDFNLQAPDEDPILINKAPSPQIGLPVQVSTSPFESRWSNLFYDLVEVQFTVP